MIKAFTVEKWEEDSFYHIKMTDSFYSAVRRYFRPEGLNSYNNIYYTLFNLLPYDFYHYISYKYKAILKKNCVNSIVFFFKEKADAENFAKECNRLFNKVKELIND